MLDVLAKAQAFAREAELLLDGVKGRDEPLGLVRAVEVPGVEAGEVLECAEEFVAADWVGSGLVECLKGERRKETEGDGD